MITSQTTPIQDFEYLNNLDLDGKTDLLNSESQKLIEKYGSGDAFKQAYLNATKESKKLIVIYLKQKCFKKHKQEMLH